MRLRVAIGLLIDSAWLLGCSAPGVQSTASMDTQRFAACWAFSWGDAAGTWDAPLPQLIRLSTQPLDTISSPENRLYRATASYTWEQPQRDDSVYSLHPLWRRVAPDSLEVDLSGEEHAPKVALLRARWSAGTLEGFLGMGGERGFRPLVDFRASQTRCPCSCAA